jgi:hypothetical protein
VANRFALTSPTSSLLTKVPSSKVISSMIISDMSLVRLG